MNNFFILNLSKKILVKKHIFDTLCCSNSKVFVRYMAKAPFLSARVKNGSSGAEMAILASLLNCVQDDLRMLMRTAYLNKYGKIRNE